MKRISLTTLASISRFRPIVNLTQCRPPSQLASAARLLSASAPSNQAKDDRGKGSKGGFWSGFKNSIMSNDSKTQSTSQRSGKQPTKTQVKHEPSKNRFTLDLGGGEVAWIDYKKDAKIVDMYHSEVPARLRGRGIGKLLAKGALDSALANNMRVRLSCSYLADYAKKYADQKHKDIIEKN